MRTIIATLSRLIRTRRAIACTLLLAFIGLAQFAQGQQKLLRVNAATTYGISYADGAKFVSEKWIPGQDTVKLKWAWARWKNAGMDLPTFRSTYVGCAVLQDIAWTGEAPNNLKSGYQNTYTYADFTEAVAQWFMNRECQMPRGGIEGASSFWYAGQGSDQGQNACEFLMDDATWWPANATERRLIETPNADMDNNGAYNESFRLERIKLTGPDKGNDGITRIGLFIKRAGECSYINQVRSDQFSYGIVINDGVPLTGGTVTAFYNSMCGVCGLGTWGATINFQTISGDDNGELVGSHPGYGGAAGGTWTIGMLKHERDVTAGASQYGEGNAGFFEGQYSVNIANTNLSNGKRGAQPMFKLNPTIGGGSGQSSLFSVQGKGFNYDVLVKNLVTGNQWSAPGDYAAFEAKHYAKYDRLITGIPEDIRPSSSPTQPCTGAVWVLGTSGPWGACTNGLQTRYTPYVSSIAGCTPTAAKPADQPSTQSCTVTPTSSYSAIASAEQTAHPAMHGVDGTASTYWASGKGQAVGDSYVINLGKSATFKGISFKAGPDGNSWPLTYKVETSLNGTANSWTQRPTTGTYSGAATSTASFSQVNAQYVRITITAIRYANGPWWEISEFSVTP